MAHHTILQMAPIRDMLVVVLGSKPKRGTKRSERVVCGAYPITAQLVVRQWFSAQESEDEVTFAVNYDGRQVLLTELASELAFSCRKYKCSQYGCHVLPCSLQQWRALFGAEDDGRKIGEAVLHEQPEV